MFSSLRNKQNNNINDVDNSFNEELLKVLEKAIKGDYHEIDLEKFKNNEVAKKWNQMINTTRSVRRSTALQINDLLQTITKMDMVKEW